MDDSEDLALNIEVIPELVEDSPTKKAVIIKMILEAEEERFPEDNFKHLH